MKNLGRSTDIKNLFTSEGGNEYKQKMIVGMMRESGFSDNEIMQKYPDTKPFLQETVVEYCARKEREGYENEHSD